VSVSDGHPPFFEEFSMYTMVLMMAAGSAGESPDFFRNKSSGCTGSVVAASAGCTGYATPAGCTGYAVSGGCYGAPAASAGCQGERQRGGFLGLRGRLFGGRDRGNGCQGAVPAFGGCYGSVVTPDCGGCAPVYTGGGCLGTTVLSSPTIGYQPSTPVTMPQVPPADPKK